MRLRWAMSAALLGACGGSSTGDAGRIIDRDAQVVCGAPGSVAAGAACTCGSECAGDGVCLAEDVDRFPYPRGLCAVTCRPGDDSSCGPGESCVADDLGAVCMARCTTAAECGPGRLCAARNGSPVCFPYCDEDTDCRSGHCEGLSGRCTRGEPPVGAGLDAACTRNEDCASGSCFAGRCQTACSTSAPHCPMGALCVPIASGIDVGTCHFPCGASDACPTQGTTCVEPAPGVRACLAQEGCFGAQGDNTDGRACGCDLDCDADSRCAIERELGFGHGACFRQCDADPSVCMGSVCSLARATGGISACHTACTSTADCGIGRVCDTQAGECEILCLRDSDCLSRQCNHYTGFCTPSTPTDLANGEECAASSECRSGLCFTFAEPGQAVCTSFCSPLLPACPDGGICVPFGTDANDYGLCAKPCAAPADCPAGQSCVDREVRGVSYRACLAPGT